MTKVNPNSSNPKPVHPKTEKTKSSPLQEMLNPFKNEDLIAPLSNKTIKSLNKPTEAISRVTSVFKNIQKKPQS